MVVEARQSIDSLRVNLGQQPDLVVVGEVVRGSNNWEEWRYVYIAPKTPTYGLRGIQAVNKRFLQQGFEPCNGTYQDDEYLHLGSIKFDEGNTRRLLISTYPDEEMASEAYEWANAFSQGTGQELRARYALEGRKEPYTQIVPIDIIRSKWFHYQAGRIKSALTFWNRPVT